MFTDYDEREYVIGVLTKWIALDNTPRATLVTPFVGTPLPEKVVGGSPGDLVGQVVRLCEADQWNNDPPWLLLLLDASQLAVSDAKIAALVERLHHPPPRPAEPFNTTILDTGAPFVDRIPFRNQVRGFFTDAGRAKPILIVSGLPKTGKSYSAKYMDYFSRIQSLLVTCVISFDPVEGMQLGPAEIARELVYQMGRSPDTIPAPDTNQKLYVQQLALWVLNQAAQMSPPQQCWFILDNFRGETLRPETNDFVIALSDRVSKGVFPQHCRLILIDFDRARLTVDADKIQEENTKTFPSAEVIVSVKEILSRAPVPVDTNLITPLIMKGLPADETRMSELNVRLRALLCTVPEVRDIVVNLQGADYTKLVLNMLTDLPAGENRMTELRSRLASLRESVGGM